VVVATEHSRNKQQGNQRCQAEAEFHPSPS
jgi:hypothetical protein